MIDLIAFNGYCNLNQDDVDLICNGAGAKNDWRSKFIPNTIYGLDCSEVFNIHDYSYFIGTTSFDKRLADNLMFSNLMAIINSEGGWLRWFRRRRALKYYEAVYELGHDAFFTDGKHDNCGQGWQDGKFFDIVAH